jgi:hypothetical protein
MAALMIAETIPVPRWIPTLGSTQSPMNAPIMPITTVLVTLDWSPADRPIFRSRLMPMEKTQIGNTIGAEHYYQHAEHYFRSMSSDSEGT